MSLYILKSCAIALALAFFIVLSVPKHLGRGASSVVGGCYQLALPLASCPTGCDPGSYNQVVILGSGFDEPVDTSNECNPSIGGCLDKTRKIAQFNSGCDPD